MNVLRGSIVMVAGAVLCLLTMGQGGLAQVQPREVLEYEKRTDYSHIKIVWEQNRRTLYSVFDNGYHAVESSLNLARPHDLLVPYTKLMFLSYLFRPCQGKVAIIGLGGGSMIHFLKHYDPCVKVDAVEIDPVMVFVADRYFGVRGGGNVNIITGDGFEFFKTTRGKYDVVYMDAFLKPSADTDDTGVALRLKTRQFYKEIQQTLTPDGVVVFNINDHARIGDDVKTIRESFGQAYPFEVPVDKGLVVVATMSKTRVDRATVLARARVLDCRFRGTYSYVELASKLTTD